jgi:secreted PhoX family phosphatase
VTDLSVSPSVDAFDQVDDLDDLSANPSTATPFGEVVQARLSRRSVLTGSMLAAAGFMTSRLVADVPSAYAAPAAPADPSRLLGYTAVPLSTKDEIVVPRGYTARPFVPWGTPILRDLPAFSPGTPGAPGFTGRGGNTAAQQAQQLGMHHDGMHFFAIGGAKKRGRQRGLLVINHEYTDESYLHTGEYQRRPDPKDATKTISYAAGERANWTAEMVRKSQAAHGVSVVEVRRSSRTGQWEAVRSGRNRRITATTRMAFSGPAAGHRLLRTSADPRGETPLGTINNCSHGYTPWGTYLACEENFNGYFAVQRSTDPAAPFKDYTPEQQALLARYGGFSDSSYNWSTHDPRFAVTPAQAQEPHRFGWVVEIDPFAPDSTPVKRTALGRLKHEGAFVHVADDGRVVVYMGDDQANDYAYKFVSAQPFAQMRSRGVSPLDEGTLYVARFNEDGSGTWLPLVQGQGPLTAANGFADQGDVLVKTRLAADALRATPMDRPEWTSVDPNTGVVYLTLTNNSSRTSPNGPNPRVLTDSSGKTIGNPFGQVVRWEEAGGDHTATSFRWELFVLAGAGRDSGDGSTVAPEDAFGSPDGMWVDPDSRVWIQTDGRQPESANDQMLAANPFVRDASGTPEIKRFLTGVIECEVTGVITTPDQRTMFINIQHPGEDGGSTWPRLDGLTTPRSSTVVITKDDGGVIGT